MKSSDIINLRLINQQIAHTNFTTPEEIVSWMIAMQSQEFAMAKWAIGLRLPGSTEAAIDKAFNDGRILRTHLMRPTWHFVTPMDIRWLLELTAPRVHAINGFTYRKFGLDTKLLNRSKDIIAKLLDGGRQLTRSMLQAALAKAKIKVEGIPLSAVMMSAELDGIICSGARTGKQFTYALLDELVPKKESIHRDEALFYFCKRYFTSRGPATVKDFANWSGLAMKDVREAATILPPEFTRVMISGQEYIFLESSSLKRNKSQKTFLLPDYDEYGMSYKDRSALFLPSVMPEMSKGGNAAYQHMIVLNGTIGGTWKAVTKNGSLSIETTTYTSLNKSDEKAIEQAIKIYKIFFQTNPI